jgi:hypothetical protein
VALFIHCHLSRRLGLYSSKQKTRPKPGVKETFISVKSTDYRVLTQPELAFDHSY